MHNKEGSSALRHRRGFTLIEALIAMILVGIAIAALMTSNQSFTSANGAGLELSTAEFLIEQIREATVTTPFAQLQTNFNNKNFSPPHDSRGNTLTAYTGYSQVITAQHVNASDLNTTSASATAFMRITVEVRLNGKTLSSARWLRADY